MKVGGAEGRLAGISKDMPQTLAVGENVGILKLTAETSAAAFEKAGRIIRGS